MPRVKVTVHAMLVNINQLHAGAIDRLYKPEDIEECGRQAAQLRALVKQLHDEGKLPTHVTYKMPYGT